MVRDVISYYVNKFYEVPRYGFGCTVLWLMYKEVKMRCRISILLEDSLNLKQKYSVICFNSSKHFEKRFQSNLKFHLYLTLYLGEEIK